MFLAEATSDGVDGDHLRGHGHPFVDDGQAQTRSRSHESRRPSS